MKMLKAIGIGRNGTPARNHTLRAIERLRTPAQLRCIARLCAAFAICALCAAAAAAQGSRRDDVVFGPTGRPMAGVSVAICTEPATTTSAPCSPLATLYSNAALTTPLANPLSTDGLGNYFFYAAPGKYTIQIYGPGITTRILPDVILPSDPSAPTFTSVTTTSGISAFSLSLAGNLAVSGNVSVAGTLTVDGNPITSGGDGGGGGASLSANNIFTGNDSFKGPIPYWDWQAWGASGSVQATTASSSVAASSTTIPLTAAIDFADGEGIAINGAGATTSLATPTGAATIIQGTSGSTSHTYKISACDSLRGCSAIETVSTATAPATITPNNYVQGAVNPESGAAFFAIYKDGAPWDTFSAEASPPYAIGQSPSSNIVRTGGSSVTATVNQYCPECNYAIVGSQITVSGTTNFNGTFTVTSISYVSGAILQLNWTSSGTNATETAGSIAQPIPWFDRGAGALAQWPSNVPTSPSSSAMAERYIGGVTAGAGTTTLTISPATTTAVASSTAIQHDDTAAANAADAACAAAGGGLIYVPHGSYNIFGSLTFAGAEGSPCTLEIIGNVYAANTTIVNQGWSFEGIGGGNVVLPYAQAPNAGWSATDAGAGAYPVWYSAGGTVTLQNLYGGSTNGAYFEAGPYSTENHLVNVQVKMNATGFEGGSGALAKFLDSCCSNWISGGSYIGNDQGGPRGIDDPISFEGWSAANTPSNLDYVSGARLYNGGISLRGETSSTGPNVNMVHVSNVLMESAPTSLLDVDSRDETYDLIEIDGDSVSDSAGSNIPLINISGFANPIQHVSINVANEGAAGYGFIGSSITGVFGGPPCVTGVTILNGPYSGIFSGTATDCGFAASLGAAGFGASRVTATDNQAASAGQQGGSLNVGLQAPSGCTATPATSGGTLADGTYTYIMTALNGLDVPTTSTPYESWWSPLVSATVSGGSGHGEVSVECAASAGAASYKLYGRAGGASGITGYIANSSPTIVDTGASLTTSFLPSPGTEAGNASVVRFNSNGNHYVLQGNTGFGTAAPQHVVDAAGDFIRGQGGFINGGHMNQSAANSDFAGVSACSSGAQTIVFANAYSSTPVIIIFDETTHGGASLSAKSASSFAVICTGASDAFDYIVVGNPN